jgi:hypothetical protein
VLCTHPLPQVVLTRIQVSEEKISRRLSNSIRPFDYIVKAKEIIMRKIIVLEHISLDGIIQAPGGRRSR